MPKMKLMLHKLHLSFAAVIATGSLRNTPLMDCAVLRAALFSFRKKSNSNELKRGITLRQSIHGIAPPWIQRNSDTHRFTQLQFSHDLSYSRHVYFRSIKVHKGKIAVSDSRKVCLNITLRLVFVDCVSMQIPEVREVVAEDLILLQDLTQI